MSEILVVGSLAYDSIKTPEGSVSKTLGGSANYFSVAASLFAKVNIVGVVGSDYESEHFKMLDERNIDYSGIQKQEGLTFHWSGEYEGDLNEAKTLQTDLNVFENFSPVIPDSYKKSPYVFLANIDPDLQEQVLEQVDSPVFVACDTMNFWIHGKKPQLLNLIKKIDMLLINEGEAQLLTGQANAIAASTELLKMGPKAVVIKRGEYGFVLRHQEGFFILPAYPVARVVDPTGAGDSFAGGFFGYLAQQNEGFNLEHIKRACIYGCLVASYTVQDFGLKQLSRIEPNEIIQRYEDYRKVTIH